MLRSVKAPPALFLTCWEPGSALPPLSLGLFSRARRAQLGCSQPHICTHKGWSPPHTPLLTGGNADTVVGAPGASGRMEAPSEALALVTTQGSGCGRGWRDRWVDTQTERDTGVGNAHLTAPSIPTLPILRTLGPHPGVPNPSRPPRQGGGEKVTMSQASARGWTRSWHSPLPSCGTAFPRVRVARPRAPAGSAAAGGSSSEPVRPGQRRAGGQDGVFPGSLCLPPEEWTSRGLTPKELRVGGVGMGGRW